MLTITTKVSRIHLAVLKQAQALLCWHHKIAILLFLKWLKSYWLRYPAFNVKWPQGWYYWWLLGNQCAIICLMFITFLCFKLKIFNRTNKYLIQQLHADEMKWLTLLVLLDFLQWALSSEMEVEGMVAETNSDHKIHSQKFDPPMILRMDH